MRVVVIGRRLRRAWPPPSRCRSGATRCTLLERRGVLGGRATSYRDAVSGEDVDNGTHLMIGAYTATLDLVRRAGAEDLLLVQDDLRIDYVDDAGPSALRLPAAARAAAPAGRACSAAAALARRAARRCASALAVRFGRAARTGITLAECFAPHRPGRRGARACSGTRWPPPILNETPERAAAVLFYEVFREAFLRQPTGVAAGVPAPRLRRAPRAPRALLRGAAAGGIRRRALAETVEVTDGGAAAVCVRAASAVEPGRDRARRRRRSPSASAADAVVLAVPWHAVAPLLPERLARASRLRDALGAPARLAHRLASSCGSIAWWWTGRWSGLRGRRGASGCSTRAGCSAARARRSTWPSSSARPSAALPRPNAELAAAAEAALRRYFPAMAEATVHALARASRA